MTTESAALAARIATLPRDQALEACYALGLELDGGAPVPPNGDAASAEFLERLSAEPLRHMAEVEDLARLTLTVAAATPEGATALEEILNRIGRKAVILGGTEIIVLAGLAVTALQIIIAKGRKDSQRTTRITYAPDGQLAEVVIEEQTRYGIQTPDVRALAKGALGIGDGDSDGEAA